MRIRPYRTARNVAEGVVVSFFDITDAKRSEHVQAARLLAEGIVDAVRDPLLVLDYELRVVRGNRAYYREFHAEPDETDGRPIEDLGSHQWRTPMLHERLEKTLKEGTGFEGFEVEAEFPGRGRRRLLLNARALTLTGGTAGELVLLGFEEVAATKAKPEGNHS